MFKIIKNNDRTLKMLQLNRTDSCSFTVQVINPVDYQPYAFQNGDTIQLVARKFYSSTSNIISLNGVPIIGTSYANFYIEGSSTATLDLGSYIMQIILIQANGAKHTIVSPCFDNNNRANSNLEICGTLTETNGTAYIPSINYPQYANSSPTMFIGILNYPILIPNPSTISAFITTLRTTTQAITTAETLIAFNNTSESALVTNDNGVITFQKSGQYFGSLELSVTQNASPYLWTWMEYQPLNSSNWTVYKATGTRTKMGADGQTSFALRGFITVNSGDKIRIKGKLDSSGSLSLVSNQTTVSGQTITQYPARLSIFEI